MEINRKRVARRLASGLVAGALAFGGLALSGTSPAGAVPIEEVSDQRIAGADRYATSADVARELEDLSGDFERLIVASGENFPDALAAAGLVNDGADNGAILLVQKDAIPASVLVQMNRIDDTVLDVVVVGGTSVISEAVFDQIEDIFDSADVTRIAGANRYSTAVRVANAIGYGANDTVILTSGEGYADAVTVGSWATENETPILLATASGLPTETEDELADEIDAGGIDRVIIVGGPAAVSASVEESLVEMGLSPAGITRIAGPDRYATNLQWNIENFSTGLSSAKQLDADENLNLRGVTHVYVTGANFPDALTAAPLAAFLEGHLIMVNPTNGGAALNTLAFVGKTSLTLDSGTSGVGVSSAIFDSNAITGGINDDSGERFAQDVWVVGGQSAVPSSIISAAGGAAESALTCTVTLRSANSNRAALVTDGTIVQNGPTTVRIDFAGNLQTGTDGELALLTDSANFGLIEVDGGSVDTTAAADEVDLNEDGFTDAIVYTLEDSLEEGDSVTFEGVEIDAGDYNDGADYGLRELSSCTAEVQRDSTAPTVSVFSVVGYDEIWIEFSERMNEDYSSDLDDDSDLEAALGEDVSGCAAVPGSGNSQYVCDIAAAAAAGAEIAFTNDTYYDWAGNELDAADAVADFEVVAASAYKVDIEELIVDCKSVGSGGQLEAVLAGYMTDAADLGSSRSGLITIPFETEAIHLIAGPGAGNGADLKANDWTFTIETQRGLLVPTVAVDGTDVTVTIDINYHDARDVARAISSSSVGRGGLAPVWIDNGLVSVLYDIQGEGGFDADNLGTPFSTADADLGDIGATWGAITEAGVELVVANEPFASIEVVAQAIKAGDDPTTAEYAAAAETVAGALFGVADHSCLFIITTDVPILDLEGDNAVVQNTGSANSAGELRITFGLEEQGWDETTDVIFDDSRATKGIYGILVGGTDPQTSPSADLYINDKSTASAS